MSNAQKPTQAKRPKRIPLRITDTTLRDAHQSLWATRMRTDDIMRIIDAIDQVGYYSLEVWGGATFDVCLRFLREDPWERLRLIKARAKKTQLQMLLRGQNILGYRNYPDDLLEQFVAHAYHTGVDIFRIFDALNDTRNLEHAIECVKRVGAHAQGTLSYTVSPAHTVQKYVSVAREMVRMGVDSICIKDMAGILSPIAADQLVSALVRDVDVPIQLHCHATSGMATASYVEGVRAGAGAIDCAISPMAGYQSQPPVETMLAIFEHMPYHADLDMDALKETRKYFLKLKRKRALGNQMPENVIDPDILLHHIPGGMISNLRSQLAQQNALDRLDEVFEELPIVRKELGYPPLVTPTSQIIGTQAVLNVLMGERYKLVPQEVKDYVKGLYGQPPAKISDRICKKILGTEKPVDCRPADLLEPMLPTAGHEVEPGLIASEEDVLSYCLFPEPAVEYFKWRALPIDERPPSPAELEQQKDAESREGKKDTAPPTAPFLPPEDYRAMHELLHKVHSLNFSEFTIRRNDLCFSLKGDALTRVAPEAAPPQQAAVAATPAPTVDSAPAAKSEAPPAAQEPSAEKYGLTIDAPLTGTFYASPAGGKPACVQEGDVIDAGTTVCMVEAMKLFNEVKATVKCKVIKILAQNGQSVKDGQALVAIEACE